MSLLVKCNSPSTLAKWHAIRNNDCILGGPWATTIMRRTTKPIIIINWQTLPIQLLEIEYKLTVAENANILNGDYRGDKVVIL